MLTRIDHVMICVPDLQHGIDPYTRLEFNGYPGGVRHGRMNRCRAPQRGYASTSIPKALRIRVAQARTAPGQLPQRRVLVPAGGE